MQLKKGNDTDGWYDYTLCGDCEHRPVCEESQVICGSWLKKTRDAQQTNFLEVMRAVSVLV